MARVIFYAGPEDNEALREKIQSMGLHVYKGIFDGPGVPVEQDRGVYHGYISFLPPEKLHPYAAPHKQGHFLLSQVTDPLIGWHKSYTTEHEGDRYIIHGNLSWAFSDASRSDELAAGKAYFGQLSRWIRKNWPPARKRGTCRGPQAQRLIQFESHIPRGLPPDMKITYVEVPDRSRKASTDKQPPINNGIRTNKRPVDREMKGSRYSRKLSRLFKFIVFPILLVATSLAMINYLGSL